ncbi:efflux RND transporter periplasmic adaptor subunit [Limisphaera sp. 4302-co]|uniref:efflux RND transporter periplasmic adaptor subunit n=1 Tax=Limisphaera sp. 4302-co TaxID=3400417 RepID=UPI003C14102B
MKALKLLAIIVLLVGAALGGYYLGTRSGPGTARAETAGRAEGKTLYTCGMHPQVIQDRPGNCPICGMKLTPIRKTAPTGTTGAKGERKIKYWRAPMDPTYISDKPGKSPMGIDLIPVYEDEEPGGSTIVIDPVTIQNMGIRTTVVTNGPLRRTIRTVGIIEHDETSLADVTVKFRGWIEKLYVDYTGAQVHKGDPLFEIYSPELYSAQIEYLLALEGLSTRDPGREALRQTARLKLEYWDISEEQIAELERTRKPRKTLRVVAPIDGFVREKNVVEGEMVQPGQRLYRLADLSIVWVHAQVYEQDLPFIELGQEALMTLSYLPDRKFRGRVTYIYPNLDEKTRTLRVRMEFHNPGFFLKPGMYARVELTRELDPVALLVPESAVLRSGTRNTVFVALGGGRFEPRQVRLGPRAEDDMVQVFSGLLPGERVVVSGQFMLDSESQLREALQKMLEPEQTGPAPMAMPGMTNMPAQPAPAATPQAEKLIYICPMPEHVAIEYDHPGQCPICGMTLVPVSEALLEKIHPGGTVEYYTCPMSEHADVKLDKPGKCPRCRMTLIPVMGKPKPPAPEPSARPQPQDQATAAPMPTLYTCPMKSHAHVVSDKPGKCPECEMDLVPTSTVEHGKIVEEHWRKAHPPAGMDPLSDRHEH